MQGADTEIYEGKSFSNLLKDICVLSETKRGEINSIVKKLVDMVKDSSDAVNIAPVIQKFIDVSVKNDDQLVKVATIVQRIITVENQNMAGDLENVLSPAEKDELFRNATQTLEDSKEVNRDFIDIKSALKS